ncbi:hypothetical protein [Paenilisteria weihenstephanensis]|uniref:Uncharacterized protein n=1 Tax=Listeria weihenstephanensis TaxID=1006155 RepID=A0A1S7FQL5_9LIST|nr:hypothetical protein [Listeria weihenstephanensis]AQY49659.1 hypothetical protein UE46_00315 [Listeria weihenstephanensis]
MWGFILYLVGGIISSVVGIIVLDSKTSIIKKMIGVVFFLGLGSVLLKNAWESGKAVFGG